MRVLITGGTGFVGLAIARQLAGSSHEALAMYHSEPDELVLSYLKDCGKAVRLVRGDVTDPTALRELFTAERPEAVIHAAVLTALGTDLERQMTRQIIITNLEGTANVALAAAEAGVRRAVHVSSSAVFPPGRIDDPAIDEDTCIAPVSLYGISKLSSEMLWRRIGHVNGISTASARIAQPYGPMERASGSRPRTSPIHEWVSAARAGDPLRIPSWPAGKDWTYVDDTAAGIAAVATAPSLAHDLYHLGVGVNWSVEMVLTELRALFPNLDVETISEDSQANPNISGYGLKGPLAATRIAADLGFRCATDLGEGLRRYDQWLALSGNTATLAGAR